MKVSELYSEAESKEHHDPDAAIVLYQKIIDNYDYSTFSDKANSAIDRLVPNCNVVNEPLLFISKNIKLIIFVPLFVFIFLGPFFGGFMFFFTPVFLFVYIVGVFPAALAGILFSSYVLWLSANKNKKPFSGIVLGSLCGLVSITILLLFWGVSGHRDFLSNPLVFLAVLSGAVCGGISLNIIVIFSESNFNDRYQVNNQ